MRLAAESDSADLGIVLRVGLEELLGRNVLERIVHVSGRVAVLFGAPELLDRVRRVNDLVSVQCSTPSILALRRVWDRLPEFRRKAMRPIARYLATLRRSGVPFIEPEAGLTAFVRVGDGDRCMAAMTERGVGVATGSFFGDNRYVRVFLGADPAIFREGIQRLVDYVGLADYLGGGKK